MGKRILVAVVCIPLIFVIFYLLPPIFLPIMISALSMVAVHEVLWSTGFVKNPKISALSIALSGVIPFWVFIGEGMRSALVGIFLYFLLIFVVAISSHYTVTLEKMGGSFFFAMLIPYFLSSFVRLSQQSLGDCVGIIKGVHKILNLIHHSGHYLFIAVSGAVYSDPRVKIQIRFPFFIVNIHTFGPLRDHGKTFIGVDHIFIRQFHDFFFCISGILQSHSVHSFLLRLQIRPLICI